MPETKEESTFYEVRANDKKVSRYQRAKLAASKAAAAAKSKAAAGATAAKKMSTRKKKPPPPEIGLYDLPTAPPPTTPQRPSPPPPTPREEAKEPPAPPPAAPARQEETPKEKLSRKERRKREDAAKKAAAAALAKKTTREAREARERRYKREIDDARRSLVEQKEMWLGLVKDSEQQCRDLELEVAAVTREEAALGAQLEDVRRNDDGAVEVLTGELVAMKLRAAELSNECDMLDHHAQLVRRQAPQPR